MLRTRPQVLASCGQSGIGSHVSSSQHAGAVGEQGGARRAQGHLRSAACRPDAAASLPLPAMPAGGSPSGGT